MTGMSYRVPAYPVKPGEQVPVEDFRIIQVDAGEVDHHLSGEWHGLAA